MRGRVVLVLGLGETGLSAVRHLTARGAEVHCADTREQPPGLSRLRAEHPGVPLLPATPAALDGVDELCVSPGLDPQLPLLVEARERALPCLGDIEYFARAVDSGVVGITGTNGKSTVTSLLGRLGEAAGERTCVGGNLMPPALDLVTRDCERRVLELSSFQLELTSSLQLDVAVHLNLAPDHLDRYGDMASYAAAKRRIFRHARAAVVNAAQPLTHPPADFRGVRVAVGDASAPWRLEGTAAAMTLVGRDGTRIGCDALALQGRHNLENALFALCAGSLLGYPSEAMLEALRHFEGLPHRCELVGRRDGVTFINDSKATNAHAAAAAVAGLAEPQEARILLIAGGLAKEADFGALARASRGRVRQALLIGRDRAQLRRDLDAAGVPCRLLDDLETAVAQAAAMARSGDVVLLSPGCASFDAFENYVARGDAFRSAARALGAAA